MTDKHYWIYILYCKNNSYYTGYTIDLNKRYQHHFNGKGSKYTRSFKPLYIAQYWKMSYEKSIVMKIERRIKKLSRIEKEKLILSPDLLFILFKDDLT